MTIAQFVIRATVKRTGSQHSQTPKARAQQGHSTYMVMDDMEVKPLSTTSLVTLLSQFNVNDIRDIEEKLVDVGMDEVCHSLLISCLISVHYNCQIASFALSIMFIVFVKH